MIYYKVELKLWLFELGDHPICVRENLYHGNGKFLLLGIPITMEFESLLVHGVAPCACEVKYLVQNYFAMILDRCNSLWMDQGVQEELTEGTG